MASLEDVCFLWEDTVELLSQASDTLLLQRAWLSGCREAAMESQQHWLTSPATDRVPLWEVAEPCFPYV